MHLIKVGNLAFMLPNFENSAVFSGGLAANILPFGFV